MSCQQPEYKMKKSSSLAIIPKSKYIPSSGNRKCHVLYFVVLLLTGLQYSPKMQSEYT